MKKIIPIVISIAILAITSCFDEEPTVTSEPVGNFWAQNAVTQVFYLVDAEKLAETQVCEVWVEKGSGITAATAQNIANEYTQNIYPKMMNNFGWEEDVPLTNGQSIKMNTMEYAHAFASGSLTNAKLTNAKLTLLLLDIKDGYQPGVNESYVAGYFWPYDFFASSALPQGYESNELDMIYIDTYPGFSGDIKEVYTTLAHEMQHLMNFTSSIEYRLDDSYIYPMDLWIDEGLSSAAEWIYSEKHLTDRIKWFIQNGDGDTIKGKIDVGNNFYVWDNRVSDSDPYPVLDDYATVYLFFQWLRLQSNNGIYKEIVKSPYPNYDQQAVINAFNAKKTSGADYSSWEAMLKDWLKANNINSASGRDGYKNDTTLKTIIAPYAPAGTIALDLYPGEGVYSYSDTDPSYSESGNIKYEYLSATKTLLTYNSNSINYYDPESGTTTGENPPANIVISGRFDMKMSSSKISGPFPIGIGDVINMNKNNNKLRFDRLTIERVLK